jgi:hypothetical protein
MVDGCGAMVEKRRARSRLEARGEVDGIQSLAASAALTMPGFVAAAPEVSFWVGLGLTLAGIFLALAGLVALVTWARARVSWMQPQGEARVPMRHRRGAVLDNAPSGGARAIRAALENAQTADDIERVRRLVIDLGLEPSLLPDDVRERLGREWCDPQYGKGETRA